LGRKSDTRSGSSLPAKGKGGKLNTNHELGETGVCREHGVSDTVANNRLAPHEEARPDLENHTVDIEAARLEVERERLELDKATAERANLFLNRNFGAIVTAVVSVVAIVVSGAQVWIAYIQKDRELRAHAEESSRQWRLEGAKFFVTNRAAIFSENDSERQMMQAIIETVFPEYLGKALIAGVKRGKSGDLLRRFWKPDGAQVNSENEAVLKNWMQANGFETHPGSITVFLAGADLEQARARAVSDLNLSTRQHTITDVPDSNVQDVEKGFEKEGASVVKVRQQDGNWKVIATFPAKNP
jgi:hypothetical protein